MSDRFYKKGVTGKVTSSVVMDKEYPNLVLYSTKDKPLSKHKLVVLSSLVKNNTDTLTDEDLDSLITLYIKTDSKTVKAGRVLPMQVKSLLSLFEGNIRGYLNEEKVLEGDYLYILSN